MNTVRLNLDPSHGHYPARYSSNVEMCILGNFLATDVGCYYWPAFRNFAINTWEDSTSSNITCLEKEGLYIYLSDLYSEEEEPTRLKIGIAQYIQLLDDWEEKVCKHKPREVLIKEENGQFTVETSE